MSEKYCYLEVLAHGSLPYGDCLFRYSKQPWRRKEVVSPYSAESRPLSTCLTTLGASTRQLGTQTRLLPTCPLSPKPADNACGPSSWELLGPKILHFQGSPRGCRCCGSLDHTRRSHSH
ncbi:uncharacterized protein LOC144341379 [Macaca mulatta]